MSQNLTSVLLMCCSVIMNNPHPDPLLVTILAKELYSVKMHPGSCINSHQLMMNLKFQKANLLGIDLSREQWVQLILNSLPPEYNEFVIVGNYFTRILDLLTSMFINILNMNFLKR